MDTEKILEWREAMVKLPDNHFFDLMQLYLGKIKTPFNKQKLIEQLSAFLRKDSVREIILKSIDGDESLILTAINEIPDISFETICQLFKNKFNIHILYDKILNLEERLLIYRVVDSKHEKIYRINPLLYSLFQHILEPSSFMLAEKISTPYAKEINITDTILAGIYSFCFHNEDILKNNGKLKKKYDEKLNKIFPIFSNDEQLRANIFKACEHLGLLIKTGNCFKVQKQKWQAFATLNQAEKKIYFLVVLLFDNADFTIEKEKLQFFAQTLAGFFLSFEEKFYYTKTDVICFLYLTFLKNFSNTHLLRFSIKKKLSSLLSIDKLIDLAILFGLLCEEDSLIYLNPDFAQILTSCSLQTSNEQNEKPLLIDTSFEVTVLPDTSLTKLLLICECMEPISLQTIGRFEITKKACTKMFQQEYSAEKICNIFASLTGHQIPQNIYATISMWYENCTALSIYSGFVVSVAKDKEKFFTLDTPLKKLVTKKLATGIYLLNINDIKEFEDAVVASGMEFIFYGTKKINEPILRGLKKINFNIKKEQATFTEKTEWNNFFNKTSSEYATISNDLRERLQKINLTKEQESILTKRINRKAIIMQEQLSFATSRPLRFEKNEAIGIDFYGKIKIAERAIAENKFIEVELHTQNGYDKIIGLPEEIKKTENDAQLIISVDGKQNSHTIFIGHITKIKLIRTTILS